jgi:hypothetical protein
MARDKKSKTAKDDGKATKQPFFKNPWNQMMIVAMIGMVAYAFIDKDNEGRSMAERIYERFARGEAGDAIVQNIKDGIAQVTEGCAKPTNEEVEAHFKDSAGSKVIDQNFDADPGEICGNGKTYFCTSKPPKKPIPSTWKVPPKPGEDANYQGPEPGEPFKESPYAMPSPKIILMRDPIRDRDDPAVASEVKKASARAAGKIGYVGNRDPKIAFPDFGPHLMSLEQSLFDGDDDEVIAKQLLSRGIDFVLVDRTSPKERPWTEEKMSSLRIRLRDSVSLAWFHPVVLGSGYAMYRVAAPFDIPKYVKRGMTTRARDVILGNPPTAVDFSLPNAAVGDDEYRAIVSLRWRQEAGLKGRKLAKRISHGKNLLEAVDNAATEIRKDWASIVKTTEEDDTISVTKVPTDIKEALSKMEVEIEIIYDMCTITDRRAQYLVWYVELGLEGVSLQGKGKFYYLEPAYAVHMEITSEVQFLERMLSKQGLDEFLREPKREGNKKRGLVLNESTWMKDETYRFGRFRTVHWIEREANGEIAELYRGVPLKTIWDVSRANLVRSLMLGADWLMNNQSEDGQYAYKYTPTNKPGRRWEAGGNIVRHALNPYTLLMVNKIKPDPEYVASAKKGIEFSLSFLRRAGSRCTICHRDPPARYYNAKIGTVAVTILSILKLGDVADIREYDDVLKCLAEELLFMQDPNGHFRQYDVPLDHPYYGAESTIAPGEFVFALSRLYSHFKDEKYKKSVDKALKWYTTAWRKLEKERTPDGIYDEEHRVNLIGIIPWLVTGMNDLHKTTKDPQYADIAYEMQDWIDNEYFWYLNRSQYPDYVGASFKTHRELPAINSCQYTEGAAAAYDLAKRINRDVEKRRQVVVWGMRYCLQTQYDSYDSTFFLPVPEEAMGGYRYTIGHLKLRNDYNYHAMAAIAQAVDYLEPDDYPAERPLHVPPVLRELLGSVPNPPRDVPRTRPIGSEAAASSAPAVETVEPQIPRIKRKPIQYSPTEEGDEE